MRSPLDRWGPVPGLTGRGDFPTLKAELRYGSGPADGLGCRPLGTGRHCSWRNGEASVPRLTQLVGPWPAAGLAPCRPVPGGRYTEGNLWPTRRGGTGAGFFVWHPITS